MRWRRKAVGSRVFVRQYCRVSARNPQDTTNHGVPSFMNSSVFALRGRVFISHQKPTPFNPDLPQRSASRMWPLTMSADLWRVCAWIR